MAEIFLKFVNTGISAGWLILAVVVFRRIFPKMPKCLRPVFWGLVGVRLVLFTSVESVLSLVPSAQTISPKIMYMPKPTIHSGVSWLNTTINPVFTETFAPEAGDSANPLQILIPVLAAVWFIGMAAMLAVAFAGWLRLRRRVRMAVLLRRNIYQSENVSSPFVFGFLRPRIYLPFAMDGKVMEHVILHEQMHIARHDHQGKVLGYLLLCLYWFQPLCWAAYLLFCRDIELACDERVIREFGAQERADYSEALLALSVPRPGAHMCPVAFGEVGVKERVKNVLSYKKPVFGVMAAAVIACAVMAVCFLTNPKEGAGVGNAGQKEIPVLCWYDDGQEQPGSSWNKNGEITLPEFPGVTFRASSAGVVAVTKSGETELFSGMPVWNIYSADLNGDGMPEICATVSFGSGIVDDHIIVYDYAAGEEYTLWERGVYDYVLSFEDGELLVKKSRYMHRKDEKTVKGGLRLAETEDGARRLEMTGGVEENAGQGTEDGTEGGTEETIKTVETDNAL